MVAFIIYAFYTEVLSINVILLSMIITLFLIIVCFKFRNNQKISENDFIINLIIMAGLYFLYTSGIINIPIVNLLKSEFNYLVIIDIAIALVLLFIVSRIKLTEK